MLNFNSEWLIVDSPVILRSGATRVESVVDTESTHLTNDSWGGDVATLSENRCRGASGKRRIESQGFFAMEVELVPFLDDQWCHYGGGSETAVADEEGR